MNPRYSREGASLSVSSVSCICIFYSCFWCSSDWSLGLSFRLYPMSLSSPYNGHSPLAIFARGNSWKCRFHCHCHCHRHCSRLRLSPRLHLYWSFESHNEAPFWLTLEPSSQSSHWFVTFLTLLFKHLKHKPITLSHWLTVFDILFLPIIFVASLHFKSCLQHSFTICHIRFFFDLRIRLYLLFELWLLLIFLLRLTLIRIVDDLSTSATFVKSVFRSWFGPFLKKRLIGCRLRWYYF